MINRIETCRQQLEKEHKKIAYLNCGNPVEQGFIFPPKILKKIYTQFFKKPHYQPLAQGSVSARMAICQLYKKQKNIFLTPEQLFITSGSSEAFLQLFNVLAKKDGEILASQPGYPLLEHIAEMAHLKIKPYTLNKNNNWTLNIEDIASKINSNTQALVLISPHNPSGAIVSKEEYLQLSKLLNEHQIPLIIDEVFSDFYFNPSEKQADVSEANFDLYFRINGLSKNYALPYLKLGWIIAAGNRLKEKEDLLHHLELNLDCFLSCHSPIQEGLNFIFEEGEEFVKNYKNEVSKRRMFMLEEMSKIKAISFIPSQAAFHQLFKIDASFLKKKMTEEDFVIELMKKGFFFHPGFFYDVDDEITCVASYLCSPKLMKQALASIKSFIKN